MEQWRASGMLRQIATIVKVRPAADPFSEFTIVLCGVEGSGGWETRGLETGR